MKNAYAHLSVGSDDRRPQVYQGVCLVSMTILAVGTQVTTVSALCVTMHMNMMICMPLVYIVTGLSLEIFYKVTLSDLSQKKLCRNIMNTLHLCK